ncbi:MAG: hypothetical protein Ct9H90mP22_5880 [Gammaproteobacteria bacterium]|nr:MAG: hypothetical protein Ct9H90mP22_5880 [Gammaproteobacteria bacterium]
MEGHAAALANLDMVNGDVDISPGSQAFIEKNGIQWQHYRDYRRLFILCRRVINCGFTTLDKS